MNGDHDRAIHLLQRAERSGAHVGSRVSRIPGQILERSQRLAGWIGIALLTPGVLYREVARAERYYLRVAIIVSVILGFTYLSISTPFDRFMHAVEENVPQDNRVPDVRDAGADR